MVAKELIGAVTTYLIIPLIGLLFFLKLKKQIDKLMESNSLQNPPTIELFIIFATYGGLLIVALTVLFGLFWSGMASLSTGYLILLAPIVMGSIAFKHRNTRTFSKYHNWTFIAGLSYFIIAPITFGVLLFNR